MGRPHSAEAEARTWEAGVGEKVLQCLWELQWLWWALQWWSWAQA